MFKMWILKNKDGKKETLRTKQFKNFPMLAVKVYLEKIHEFCIKKIINQHIMNKENFLENLSSIWDGIEKFIDLKVNEKFEEISGKELSRMSYLNSTLTSDELCKRWCCCKNTLLNMEKEGTISPLSLKGKRKVYLMKDIAEVEMSGRIKGFYKLVG